MQQYQKSYDMDDIIVHVYSLINTFVASHASVVKLLRVSKQSLDVYENTI